jgi:deazaflavin-dependent oxidoreductase (nitroreductase family)
MTVTTDLESCSVIDLTTVGRVTGRLHTNEIWIAHIDSTIYMLSGGAQRSDWVRNLIRTPAVRVGVGGDEYVGIGRMVTDPQEDRVARDVVFAKYSARYSGDLTRWMEKALPIAIDLEHTT